MPLARSLTLHCTALRSSAQHTNSGERVVAAIVHCRLCVQVRGALAFRPVGWLADGDRSALTIFCAASSTRGDFFTLRPGDLRAPAVAAAAATGAIPSGGQAHTNRPGDDDDDDDDEHLRRLGKFPV